MSSFSNDAFLQRMKAVAQNRPTITPVPSRKRPRHARDGTSSPGPSEDERDENTGSIPLAGLNLAHSRPATQNAANAVKSFAKKQKLRGEQLTQVDTFLNVCPPSSRICFSIRNSFAGYTHHPGGEDFQSSSQSVERCREHHCRCTGIFCVS
jgi:hypothetical protein